MSSHPSLATLVTVSIAAFVFVAIILLSSDYARADDAQSAEWPRKCEGTNQIERASRKLNEGDQIALLERLQYALSAIGDGSTYVWRRWHGNLSATVHPTASFKDDTGQVCRHVVILLTNGKRNKKTEGIACRLPSGRWQLDG
jgi:surface antigen